MEIRKEWNSKLVSVQNAVEECNQLFHSQIDELALVQKDLTEKKEQLGSVMKSIEDHKKQLKVEETKLGYKLGAIQESIRKRNEELEQKVKELKAVEISIEERSAELEAMKKQNEERIESNKMNLEERSKELEVKIHSMRMLVDELTKKLDHKEKQSNNKRPHPGMDYQSWISENGKYLQSLLNESYRMQEEAFDAIQKSADPGNLVLDAMQGFHPENLRERDSEFDLSVVRRSCSTLLEQLLKLSPEIKPQVRDEAMKLALEWKSKIKGPCENDLEVSGFLQLLAGFKLASSFDQDELRSFLDFICPNRQAVHLRRALGLAEGLSVSHVEQVHPLQANQREDSSAATGARTCRLILDEMDVPDLSPTEVISALNYSPDPAKFVLEEMLGSYTQHIKNGRAELDASIVKNQMLLLEQLIRCKATILPSVKEGALKLATLWKENVTRETVKGIEASAFLLFLSAYGLRYLLNPDEILLLLVKVARAKNAPVFCRFLGLADKIPKLVLILLQRKQYNEAVRFICAFGFLHVFSLDTILKNCAEDIWKSAQDQTIEKELNTRKNILQCILEHKLDSVCDTSRNRLRIVDLEAQRAGNSVSVQPPSFASRAEPQLQNRHFGDDQGSNKRLRR